MAKPQRSSPTARLFVALDLPDEVRATIARWQARALADPALRPMRPESLHITMCFLNRHPEAAVAQIASLMEAVEPRPVTLQFERQVSPIPKGRPRLYAVGGASPSATELQSQLATTLAAAGFYEPEKRGFWPHVTVARVRSERLAPAPGQRRGKGRPRRVKSPPKPLPKRLTEPFGAVRIALYRSDLKPQGAEYVRLAGVDLPSPEGPRAQKR
jgi:RNA 2',3'-cyclic 3'-phosphodiesterase